MTDKAASPILKLEPYEPEPACDVRRRHTNARCEMPPGHLGGTLGVGHFGRDSRGRWHSWLPALDNTDSPVTP